jgi:hypothetical protein
MMKRQTPWGELMVAASAVPASPSARSYDSTGRVLTWIPAAGLRGCKIACDLEDTRRPPLPQMMARYGARDARQFLIAWTRCEVIAKLRNFPVLCCLARHGLTPPLAEGMSVVTLELGEKVVSLGWLAAPPRPGPAGP